MKGEKNFKLSFKLARSKWENLHACLLCVPVHEALWVCSSLHGTRGCVSGLDSVQKRVKFQDFWSLMNCVWGRLTTPSKKYIKQSWKKDRERDWFCYVNDEIEPAKSLKCYETLISNHSNLIHIFLCISQGFLGYFTKLK